MNPDHITTASARIAFSHKKVANDNQPAGSVAISETAEPK